MDVAPSKQGFGRVAGYQGAGEEAGRDGARGEGIAHKEYLWSCK